MNAYDFDNTIYDGESMVDFFLFCIKKDPKLLKYLANIMFNLLKYKLNMLTLDNLSKKIEKFIVSLFKNNKVDYTLFVDEFWNKNKKKLKPEFMKNLKPDDLIITGCPDFLISGISEYLNVKNIICSKFNFETKKIEFLCFGENKVIAYKKTFKDKKINKFYTDSLADIPFMKISSEVYLVNKNKIKKIDKDNI